MANTTADKLAKLNATKADLKAALAEKGQTVGDVFSAYPAAVRAVETDPMVQSIVINNNSPCDLRFFDEFIVRAGYQGYTRDAGRFTILFSQFSIYNLTGNAIRSIYFDYAGDGQDMIIDVE